MYADWVESRLKRIYKAIDVIYDMSPLKSSEHIEKNCITIKFWLTEEESINYIMWIFSNIWHLKDELIKTFKEHNNDGQIVEKFINESKYLWIIWDIFNSDKHPEKDKKFSKRTNYDPKIENIKSWIGIAPIWRWGEYHNPETWAKAKNVVTLVSWDVVWNQWAICTLDQLIEGWLNEREMFLDKYNYIVWADVE
jgi:hypothetical protein